MENMIYRRILLGGENVIYHKEALHFAFGIDKNFVIGLGVLIYSIIYHNPERKLSFHICTDGINEKDVSRFREYCKDENIGIKLYFVDKKQLSSLSIGFTLTEATYYRFLISDELYGKIEKFLYLDSDMLCLGNIEELWSNNFGDYTVMAIRDLDGMDNYAKKTLNLQGRHYFNAGLLYINVNKWMRNGISEKAINLLLNGCKYKYMDQDLLNKLLDGKVKFISDIWNLVYNLVYMKQPLNEKTKFIHFAGTAKPWQEWAPEYHSAVQLYRTFWSNSPWKGEPVQKATKYKQAKYMGRKYRRNKNFIKSFHWYIKYAFWKIKEKIGE